MPLPRLIIRLTITLGLPFLLLSAGARLLLTEHFLQFAYQRPGFPSDMYGFSLDDRLQYGPYAIHYLFNGETIDYLAALRLPGDKCWNPAPGAADCALFGDRELRHMADVKQMTTALFTLAAIILAVGILVMLASRYNARLQAELRLGIRLGCQLALLTLLCLTVLSAAAWDRAFDAFHQLFFAAGTWRFPFSDSLIRLYPEQLFADAAFTLAAFTAFCASLILALLAIRARRSQGNI
jgi:integral membrane protein (TIGR01906 family)